MPSLAHYQHRRSQLLDLLDGPTLLMAGGRAARNYPHNYAPYPAVSSFLFLFASPEPGAAVLLDPQDRSVTLFLHERTPADALWHGPVPTFSDMKETHGVTQVLPVESLEASVKTAA